MFVRIVPDARLFTFLDPCEATPECHTYTPNPNNPTINVDLEQWAQEVTPAAKSPYWDKRKGEKQPKRFTDGPYTLQARFEFVTGDTMKTLHRVVKLYCHNDVFYFLNNKPDTEAED